jgi:hypothetical protein
MRNIFFLLLTSVLFFSCSDSNQLPSDIIKPEKMKLVLWDFVKADVLSQEFTKREHPGTDTLENIKMQQIIFNKYKISKTEFYKSYDYYYNHTDLMNALLDSITASQNKIKVFQTD